MKKIYYSLLFTTAIIISSCGEKPADTNKLSGIQSNPMSFEKSLEIVKEYTSGDTLELFVQNGQGSYRVDKTAFENLNYQERALLGYFLLRYDCFVAADSLALYHFYEGSSWPQGTYDKFINNLVDDQKTDVKNALSSPMNNREVNRPNEVLAEMTFIRKGKELLAKHKVISSGVQQEFSQKFLADSIYKFIK